MVPGTVVEVVDAGGSVAVVADGATVVVTGGDVDDGDVVVGAAEVVGGSDVVVATVGPVVKATAVELVVVLAGVGLVVELGWGSASSRPVQPPATSRATLTTNETVKRSRRSADGVVTEHRHGDRDLVEHAVHGGAEHSCTHSAATARTEYEEVTVVHGRKQTRSRSTFDEL